MRIPTNITPLEYIAGSGSQYIETAIHLLSTDVVKSKWRFQNSAGNVYGCFTSSGADDNFCLYAGSASTNAYIRYNGQLVRDFKATSGTVYEIEQGPDGFFVGGSKVADFDAATFTCSAPMYIFMLPNSSSAKVTARCYYLQVIRDGDVVYDFIPARNEVTGEVGMWEAENGVWYGNDGTGAFTAGSAVARVLGTTHDGWRRRLLAACAKHYELVPGSDGMIWAYYDVTSTETATKVCNNTGFISGSYMVVDGVQVAKATTYLFGTTGRHLVKFSPITSWGTTTQYFASCPALVELYFPAITIQLPYRGFQNNTGLERVSFLDNASISIYSNGQQFRNCTALKYLRLPITQAGNIPGNMLIGCSNLETVELTGSGTLALSTNDPFKTGNTPMLDKLVFGPNYTSITGRLAYDSAITKMVVLATTPPTISASSTAFYGWNVTHKIYVPYSSDHSILAAYKAAANWSAQEANIYELNQDGTIPTA